MIRISNKSYFLVISGEGIRTNILKETQDLAIF